MNELSKVEFLEQHISKQFNSRAIVEANKQGLDYGITLQIEKKDNTLWVTFSKKKECHGFYIPLPYVDKGIILIENNEVKRAVCKYWLEEQQLMYDYMDVIHQVVCGDPTGLVPNYFIKKIIFMQQIVYSFENKNTATVIYNLQRAINDVVNKLPLHSTYMNSLVMNNRIVVIDPSFDSIQDPETRLKYHIEKSKKYFDRGWTPIGLSDGSLSDKNYTLAYDLKKFTPFGERFHNPQRNLYSTLSMKGAELPLVRSSSMEKMHEIGITRTGWNLITLFADIPDVWEDQIVVSRSAADKMAVTYERRIQCHGSMRVKEGFLLKYGQALSVSPDGRIKRFDILCDKAWVCKIAESTISVGGVPTKVHNIIVKFIRKLKDGVKITNTAANKGVVKIVDNLGQAIDPRTGETRELEVIVGCQAVRKRKNYTQILEALINNVTDEKGVVVPDYYCPTIEQIEKQLEEKGFPTDGTWQCCTNVGNLTGICGKVFWGVTHDVEDMLWQEEDVTRTNTRKLRTAGLKFSTVEIRALETRFGKDNSIIDELMSYSQGSSQLHEQLKILRSKKGEIPPDTKTIDFRNIKPVDQSNGTIVSKSAIEGTIADETLYPYSFMLNLPITYQIIVDVNDKVISEGYVQVPLNDPSRPIKYIVQLDKIYVPSMELRECWRHETGKYGLSEISALLNNIIAVSHRLDNDPESSAHIQVLHKVVYNYFNTVACRLGSKRGEISQYGMSIRYPFSAKAVATLNNRLPKNTIEIHKDMAELLDVQNGDVVLAERFPCMGFMSLRPQKVRVTSDENCKFTIRVSGNSLGSMTLDFDGDVLFLASFHTQAAKELLHREWTNPNKPCYSAILELNSKMGKPHIKELPLQDYKIQPFDLLTVNTHAEIVDKAVGVKSHTGPVIAFAYNIMRIMENSKIANNQKANCAVEIFLDKVGNSIFKQKHGVKALHSICIDAICTGDIDTLVAEGFKRGTSTIICDTIKEKARELGVDNLVQYHEYIRRTGSSNIISRIVRSMNKVYYASRSTYEGIELLSALQQPVVDIPSKLLAWSLSGKAESIKTPFDAKLNETLLQTISTKNVRKIGRIMLDFLDDTLLHKSN
jgi:hypothetical protein